MTEQIRRSVASFLAISEEKNNIIKALKLTSSRTAILEGMLKVSLSTDVFAAVHSYTVQQSWHAMLLFTEGTYLKVPDTT
jgi:uncharacterized membrane protein (UPF0182 family)